MTDGMEGLALIELYITNGFSCYMHWRSILPQGLKLSEYRYIIQRPKISLFAASF